MQMGDHAAEAHAAFVVATTKGGLEKPYLGYVLLAYSAFDLARYEDALAAIAKASTYPEYTKDVQTPKLKLAVDEAIKDRDAAKAVVDGKKNNYFSKRNYRDNMCSLNIIFQW